MKFYINIILILIICFNLEAKNHYTKQDTLFEIFLLKPNLHYRYDYFSKSETQEVVFLAELVTDSGTVDYIIHDSTYLNDTMALWNVEERKSILHNYSVSVSGSDTSYWIYDTTYFYIKETLTGLHQLTADGFLWEFPVISPSDTQPIFRYSNNSHEAIVSEWTSNAGLCSSGNDTLLFNESKGFTQRISSSMEGGCVNTHKYFFSYFKLHDDPIVLIFDSQSSPIIFRLEQNYPNPFNPSTTIKYSLSKSSFVTLRIYDLLGKEIEILDEGFRSAGEHSILFTADYLTSGVYFYQLNGREFVETKKLMLLK